MTGLDLEIVNPVEIEKWDEYIANLNQSSIFYTASWAEILSETYHFTPKYFMAQADGQLQFLLPIMEINNWLTGRRAVSLPFTDFCEPYVAQGISFGNYLDRIISIGQNLGWKSIELRGAEHLINTNTPSLYYYDHELSLTEPSILFAGFKKSNQRNIRKAESNGINTVIDNSNRGLQDFYRLNCITRKKHGLPPQPYSFFRNVRKKIIANNYGKIFKAKFRQKTIAAAIYFHFKDSVLYKYGASDPNFLPLRANNLVMWEAIKYFAENNYQTFDFGKTELANQGLRRFKQSWGTTEKQMSYFKYSFEKNSFITEENKETGWYNMVFRHLPIPVLKLTGKLLYKHAG